MPEDHSQRGLVERAQQGDAEAFAQLVSRRLDRSWRFVRAIAGDRVDADEVVQEAFVLVWRDLPRLRDADAFEPWLRAILVHATHHAVRRVGQVRLIPITNAAPGPSERGGSIRADALLDPRPDPSTALAGRDTLARAFARLSIDQRTILVLHYFEGYPLEFVAEVIRRPIGTAKSRLHGARAALRAALAAENR